MAFRLGLFDSGIGGFTVLKQLQKRHPDFNTIYFADTARMPYGTKSPSEIREIALEISNWLNLQEISAVVVACNTTNSIALDIVKQNSTVQVFDLISSSCDFFRNESRVGVLATPSTVSSKSYANHISSLFPSISVTEEACPEFVPMIEGGKLYSSELEFFTRKHLEPLLKADVQAIILGCSHYPLMQHCFDSFLPSHVRLIDPAVSLAKNMDKLFAYPQTTLDFAPFDSEIRFCVTSDPDSFALKAHDLLGFKPEIENISLPRMSNVF